MDNKLLSLVIWWNTTQEEMFFTFFFVFFYFLGGNLFVHVWGFGGVFLFVCFCHTALLPGSYFSHQGSKLGPLRWKRGFLITWSPGKYFKQIFDPWNKRILINLKIFMLGKRNKIFWDYTHTHTHTHTQTHHMILFPQNSWKSKIISSERKEISGCLEPVLCNKRSQPSEKPRHHN